MNNKLPSQIQWIDMLIIEVKMGQVSEISICLFVIW